MDDALLVRSKTSIAPPTQSEPVHFLVPDTPDEILANAVIAVGIEFVMQFQIGSVRRNIRNQLRPTFHVAILVNARVPAVILLDHEQGIRLRSFLLREANRGIVTSIGPRCRSLVHRDPSPHDGVRSPMHICTNR
jgi:hypothetical protein